MQETDSREDLKINFILGTPLKHITHTAHACIFLLIEQGFCLLAEESKWDYLRMPRLKTKNLIQALVKQGAGYKIIRWLNHRTDHESAPRGSKQTGGRLYH